MKKTTYVMALTFVFVAWGLAGTANAIPFQNGSFEMLSESFSGDVYGSRNTATSGVSSHVITGWTIDSGNIDYVHDNYWEASDGQYSLDLSGWGPGAISQSFDTVEGQPYVVLFDLAGNPEGPPSAPDPKMMSVTVGWYGAARGYAFTTGPVLEYHPIADMGWEEHIYSFIARDTTTTLQFRSMVKTAYGPALDNVRVYPVNPVNPVPEPSTMLLVGTGLTGLLAPRLRRKRK